MDCGRQWRTDRRGCPESIDRAAIHSTIDLWPVDRDQRSDTFHRIRFMEGIAAKEYRRRAAAAT